MTIAGWYYLHENGALIYKPSADACADIRDSNFARGLWPMHPEDRASAWRIVVEAAAAGALPDRVADLAAKWQCDDEDAAHYAEHIGARLYMDGNAWCATRKDFENLQESPAGFGDTAREALAELAKALGYRPSKMWGATFQDLLRPTPPVAGSGAEG
jgi:hypothetical protein